MTDPQPGSADIDPEAPGGEPVGGGWDVTVTPAPEITPDEEPP